MTSPSPITCQATRELLECVRPDSDDLEDPVFAPAARHLADCPDCAKVFEHLQALDRQIGRALRDVPVPEGLRERLLAATSAAAIAPANEIAPHASAPTADPRASSRGRRRFIMAAAALSACLLAGLGVWWIGRSQPITLGELEQAVVVNLEGLPPFGDAFAVRLPDFTARHGVAFKVIQSPRQVTVGAHVVCVFECEVGHRKVPGLLAIVPKGAVAGVPEISFSSAVPEYFTGPGFRVSRVAWTERELVFMLVVPDGAEAIEQLQRESGVEAA
jgi:hypothetical protein